MTQDVDRKDTFHYAGGGVPLWLGAFYTVFILWALYYLATYVGPYLR